MKPLPALMKISQRASVAVELAPVVEEHLQAATAQTPGLEAPTVSPLQREGWYAVRAMVPKNMTNQIMDGLYEAGARAILVSPIAAARL